MNAKALLPPYVVLRTGVVFFTALALFSPLGCAHGQPAMRALEVGSCAIEDERLRLAFVDPETTREWLKQTGDGLEEMSKRLADGNPATDADVELVNDAADLYRRIRECIEP